MFVCGMYEVGMEADRRMHGFFMFLVPVLMSGLQSNHNPNAKARSEFTLPPWPLSAGRETRASDWLVPENPCR